jgi:hypothetical protein
MYSAQFKPKSSIRSVRSANSAVNYEKSESRDSIYIITEIKLSSLFLDNKIPADFPKKDDKLSFEENKRVAIQWAKLHINLFKEKYRTEIDSMNF